MLGEIVRLVRLNSATKEYLKPEYADFFPAAHRIMWKKKLEHGDIGLGNLMYRRQGEEVLGVLIDWDLATMRGEEEDEVFGGGTQRTGTTPFIALELVTSKPPRRKYRHDAESMGWTLRFGCLDLNHPDNTPLIKLWLDPKLTANTRNGSLFLEAGKYKIRPGFEELFQISGAFLSKLLSSPAGLSSDSHFPPTGSRSHSGSASDLLELSVKSIWSAPQQDKQTGPDEEEAWDIFWQTLVSILDKKVGSLV